MKADIEIKASVLTAMMSEDRKEVRDIRAAIYRAVSFLTVSSFALTGFLLEKQSLLSPVRVSYLTDVVIVMFIWTLFLRYKADLYRSRQALKARQDLITQLNEDDRSDLNPFPDARRLVPDIKDRELWWLPILGTIGILAKVVAVSITCCS